jgi:hypothetical protein
MTGRSTRTITSARYMPSRTYVRLAVPSRHGRRRRRPDPDGITIAQLAGTAGRFVSRKPLDVEAAVTELREIANGRSDLLAERAGITLGFYTRENRDEWQRKALEAALLIAAGADLTRLTEWIEEGSSGRKGCARREAQRRPRGRWP